MLIGFFICLFFLFPTSALAATNYIFPLPIWNITTQHGDIIGDNYYHMGVDAGFEYQPGDPVYAVADGVVKEAQERSQFGLVVLIEHQPEGEEPNVSLYGHLRPSDILVQPGQVVKAGDIVGVLGNSVENGGWEVHIHFGIHKGVYTGQWVYYGHVHDETTKEQWHDPQTYIPARATQDTWAPVITWPLGNGQWIANSLALPKIGDLGSGVKTTKYFVSTDKQITWQELSAGTNLDLSAYADGDLAVKARARDNFNNKAISIVTVHKDSTFLTKSLALIVRPANTQAVVNQLSYGNTVLNTFKPLISKRTKYNDMALLANGDVRSIVISRGALKKPAAIKILSLTGDIQQKFRAFDKGSARITTGDVDGDGAEDIIVGSNSSAIPVAMVKAFKQDGTLLWEAKPYGEVAADLDVATGDVNNDGKLEVIVGARTTLAILNGQTGAVISQFKPFGEAYTGGINVASGNILGDGTAEIITATRSEKIAEARVFNSNGQELINAIMPFNDYNGALDVSVTDKYLLLMQASNSQNWLNIYQLDANTQYQLVASLPQTNSYNDGMMIAGWK
ncbi:MAG: peptidoglycan DD-metalloendopeptidase family protein [Patescibacteria group bacterium]